MEDTNIVVALDENGHEVVVINNIIFYGKKNIPWEMVEKYLKRYVGKAVIVSESGEEIQIGADFPDEYKGSHDTMTLRGLNAKAKANAVQGIEQMIHISRKISEMSNLKDKNMNKAKYGWNRYLTRFALPVMTEKNNILYFNVYIATLIVRKDHKKRFYLYDVIHIKKESSMFFEY